jgi:hypothetical protein
MKLHNLLAQTAHVIAAGLFCNGTGWAASDIATSSPVTQVPVVFTGGHETDPRDNGRPVALIAAGLGVSPEVFRDAFSRVQPARGREPSRDQVRKNKETLMNALGRHGVTNDQLDRVSNTYRYNRSRGEMWPTKPAKAFALVRNGVVTEFRIEYGGAGYSSPPRVSVPGISAGDIQAQLAFGRNLETNGSVRLIVPVQKKSD